MSKQERCPTLAEVVRLLHRKGLCNWDYGTYEEMEKSGAECECYEYARPILELFGHDSAPSSVAEQPSREQATSSRSGILEPHKTSLAVTEGQVEPNGAALPDSPREQAVEGLVEALRKIATTHKREDIPSPGVISGYDAYCIATDALAHYEASRGER